MIQLFEKKLKSNSQLLRNWRRLSWLFVIHFDNLQPKKIFCQRQVTIKWVWRLSKVKLLVKNRNFGEKLKFWSKIEILVKNRNFSQKSRVCSKIEILVKNRKFGQKLKCWSKIELLVKNRKFGQKSKILFNKFNFPMTITTDNLSVIRNPEKRFNYSKKN